jgi:hypothetical protein
MLSPATLTNRSTTPNDYVKRVQKRAFQCSKLRQTEINADDPTASPAIMATSPTAAKMFNLVSEGNAAVTSYLDHYVEENPNARFSRGIRCVE